MIPEVGVVVFFCLFVCFLDEQPSLIILFLPMGFPPGHRDLDETEPCDIMLHRHTDSLFVTP